MKAKGLLAEAGIPDDRSSLLAPDDTRSRHLATSTRTKAADYALMYGTLGAVVGAAAFAFVSVGTLAYRQGDVIASGWLISLLVGACLGMIFGAGIGALVGSRETMLVADFVEEDATRGGSALGVLIRTDAEADAARAAFRQTGALQVETS